VGAIEDVFGLAVAEASLLLEEMQTWQENMEGRDGLEYTPKYEEVSEVVGQMEEIESALISVQDAIFDLDEEYGQRTITYADIAPYGQKGAPRWMRAATAANILESIAEELEIRSPDLAHELTELAGALREVAFPAAF